MKSGALSFDLVKRKPGCGTHRRPSQRWRRAPVRRRLSKYERIERRADKASEPRPSARACEGGSGGAGRRSARGASGSRTPRTHERGAARLARTSARPHQTNQPDQFPRPLLLLSFSRPRLIRSLPLPHVSTSSHRVARTALLLPCEWVWLFVLAGRTVESAV